jgi:hypothetical protein
MGHDLRGWGEGGRNDPNNKKTIKRKKKQGSNIVLLVLKSWHRI